MHVPCSVYATKVKSYHRFCRLKSVYSLLELEKYTIFLSRIEMGNNDTVKQTTETQYNFNIVLFNIDMHYWLLLIVYGIGHTPTPCYKYNNNKTLYFCSHACVDGTTRIHIFHLSFGERYIY